MWFSPLESEILTPIDVAQGFALWEDEDFVYLTRHAKIVGVFSTAGATKQSIQERIARQSLFTDICIDSSAGGVVSAIRNSLADQRRGGMEEQTMLITLLLTGEDLATGFSVTETETSVILFRHARAIAEFSKPRARRTEAKEIKVLTAVPFRAREAEILQHLARGEQSREIASALGVERKTVDSCVNRVMLKLGAKNRVHAVAIALSQGLICGPENPLGEGAESVTMTQEQSRNDQL